MVINNYRPTYPVQKEKKRGTILKWMLFGLLLIVMGVVITAVVYEARTSRVQAQKISAYAATLTYQLDTGQSNAIIFPKHGPFDKRLGYVEMPRLLDRVQGKGFRVFNQSRFSPALFDYTSLGYFAPYPEKTQTGLLIKDYQGRPVYEYRYPLRVYASYEAVPSLVTQSVLYIENRQLLALDKPFMNPAVDWLRFSKAGMHMAANKAGLNYHTMGASTLATQIEKYRHSPAGITTSPMAKLKQMASASVRVYQSGPETLPARQTLALDWINTLPLYGAPGYGEVHGLGDGLWVWFGADFDTVNQLLRKPVVSSDSLSAQGKALRQVLSLIIAQRRPAYYFSNEGRKDLNALTGSYLRLLAKDSYISPGLRDAGLAEEVTFREFNSDPVTEPLQTDKGALMVRTYLAGLMGKSLYDLNRMDLVATTSMHHDLQVQVSEYLHQLNDPAFAKAIGLYGDRLLSPEQTKEVRYSFTLLERTPQGNLVRVQTDNSDQPFDLNAGSKLELGSTAKLRVLVTYLEIIAEIHAQNVDKSPTELMKDLGKPQDELSRWVQRYLLLAKNKSLTPLLNAALQRRYAASPYESFFTGGGMHRFHNFRNEDNGSRPTVHEAFVKSINLPFVRLTRDIVRYSIQQQVGNSADLLNNPADPRRREYLTQFADHEGKVFLLKFWHKYKGKLPEERLELLLGAMRLNPVKLATVHRFLYPDTDSIKFAGFMRSRLPGENLTDKRMMELYHMYGPAAFNLSDQGYLSGIHPLELWLLDYMLHTPDTSWNKVVEASTETRQEVYIWLFRSRHKRARDARIRTMLELDAYAAIQKRWQRVGYPFDALIPSLATALGSSGDRPDALAELMGIIQNNGIRLRTLRIQELHFAAKTPYETNLNWLPVPGEQVMVPEVAAVVREALQQVVDVGTARRLQDGIASADGSVVQLGGKTGTGDNKFYTLSRGGHRLASRTVNRTATFAFIIGDKHFGTVTAFVPGSDAADFHFTSSLPVQVLSGMSSILAPYLAPAQPKESQQTKLVSLE